MGKSFTVDKELSVTEQQSLARDKSYVVLRGADEENVHVFKGRFETLLGEAALIVLQDEFRGAVFRSPDACFQGSYDHLVVGFNNDGDAKQFATKVENMKRAARPRSPYR